MKKLLFIVLLASIHFSVSAQSLNIMTYNIRLDIASDGENAWKNRKEFLASQIRFYETDIFGVQEALPNQMDDLTQLLPEYSHVGIGRDEGGKGEASAIFFRKDRFNVSDSGTFWLSETPEKVSKGWDATYNRICTYALFKDTKTKKKFWVFNTHFDHIAETARRNSVTLITSRVKEVNKKNLPVILTGDFNAEPTSEVIKAVRASFTDTRDISLQRSFGPAGTFNAFKHNEPVTRLIDYIFVNNASQFAVKRHGVLSDSINLRYPSDHFPVFAELEVKK